MNQFILSRHSVIHARAHLYRWHFDFWTDLYWLYNNKKYHEKKKQIVCALGDLGVGIGKLPIKYEEKINIKPSLAWCTMHVLFLIWYKWFMNTYWRNSEYGANNSVKKLIGYCCFALISCWCSGMWALCTYCIVTHACLYTHSHTERRARIDENILRNGCLLNSKPISYF